MKKNWRSFQLRERSKGTTTLPFGWVIQEVGCGHESTFEIWFEGKFMDERATRAEAEEFVMEMEACRPEEGPSETKIQ